MAEFDKILGKLVDRDAKITGAAWTVDRAPLITDVIELRIDIPKGANILLMTAKVLGTTPSMTWTVRHSTTYGGAGTEVVTGGTVTTTEDSVIAFNASSIPTGSDMWIEITAVSGTIESAGINIYYK